MTRYREIIPKDLDPEVDPWERQPDESADAHGRFTRYRDMNPRSLRQVAREHDVALNSVTAMAKRWRWQERCLAWDRWMRQVEDAELVKERRSAAKRHAQLAAGHLSALALSTNELAKRVGEDPKLLEKMDLETVLRVEAAFARATPRLVAAERLSLGMTTEIVGDVGEERERELASRTDDELRGMLTGGGADGSGVTDYLDGLEAGARAKDEAQVDSAVGAQTGKDRSA